MVENAKKCQLYSKFPYTLLCAKSKDFCEILGILNSSFGNF